MKGELEVRVTLEKLPLSRTAADALRHLDRYDAILFTSKSAQGFFEEELKRRRVAPPHARIICVGPREDLLKFDLKGKRVLFPRSAFAPSDIVRKLRAKGAIVQAFPLYTVAGIELSQTQKHRLLNGEIRQLYFKSPSGVDGLLRRVRGKERNIVLSLPARCIGQTTAQAARKAGFEKVFIQ